MLFVNCKLTLISDKKIQSYDREKPYFEARQYRIPGRIC